MCIRNKTTSALFEILVHSPIYILLSAGGHKRCSSTNLFVSIVTKRSTAESVINKYKNNAFPFQIIFLKPPNAQQGVSTIENK